MSDIFQEVDEDVRRDRAVEYWNKNQNKILGVCLAIVLATAGYRFWQYERLQANQTAGAAFESALALVNSGKSTEAAAAFSNLAGSAPAGYQMLARFAKAGQLAPADPKSAIAAYDALATDAAIPAPMAEAAKLRGALLRLDNGEAEKGAEALTALAGSASPYRDNAREALAAVALQKGDYAGAAKWLDQIVSDADAPAGAKKNAEIMLGLVASNAPPK
jgi:hypothetical protein